MKKAIFDIFDRLKQVRRDKESYYQEQRQAEEQAGRIEDLMVRFHRVGEIQLPLPNLFAKAQMDAYFGSWDNIDLQNDRHLTAMIFFLENCRNKEIDAWSREQLDAAISERMTDIALHEKDAYVSCIEEIFLAIKKNSIRHQRDLLFKVADQFGIQEMVGAQS